LQDAEIARLTAILKKTEAKAASLERSVEQKIEENRELTSICDELIAKVGTS
jgi:transcriptional regulator